MQIANLIVLTSLLVVTTSGWRIQTIDDLLRQRSKCVRILDLQENADVSNGQMGLLDFPDDGSAKCMVKCIMNRMGLFNEKRGAHVGRLVRQMKFASSSSTKEIRDEIQSCADRDLEQEDGCDRAYALYQCIQNSNLLQLKSPEPEY
ncbi:general odorant-binding protein 99b-like [Uranotaenia lowii]|uniref:general odorant-binding protein 99b-like n=1 Tax=Uranotaenia lowii TaxID=190385 RepID=UPI00247B12D9|nr:general odorant-binding protein 99b-like [Uranotaenia lowii]